MLLVLILAALAVVATYAFSLSPGAQQNRAVVLFLAMFVRQWWGWMAGRIREYMGGAGR